MQYSIPRVAAALHRSAGKQSHLQQRIKNILIKPLRAAKLSEKLPRGNYQVKSFYLTLTIFIFNKLSWNNYITSRARIPQVSVESHHRLSGSLRTFPEYSRIQQKLPGLTRMFWILLKYSGSARIFRVSLETSRPLHLSTIFSLLLGSPLFQNCFVYRIIHQCL